MKRQRNIEAFTDKRGVVHPIRRSSGYDDEKTGSTDFDFRDWAAEEREQRKAEERELERDYARYHPEAGKSLATFVRQRGGFRYDGIHDGEIDRLRKAESGTSGLVSLDKGKGLTFKRGRGLKPDRMLETAIEAGVVSPDTSLAQFMDDVEMSATKRNPFPTATVEKAWQAWRKAEKAKSPKAQALETKFVKVYMASQKRKRNPMSLEAARRIRDKKEERSYKLLQKAAHKAIHAKTEAGKKKAEKAYTAAERAFHRVQAQAVTRRRVAAGLEKKRNFTIKAAGRLKVGNPGVQRVRRLRARTAKQERISPELGAKAYAQSERAFKQWAVARDRRVGKAIVSGRKWPKFGKQNPPATLKLEGVTYNVLRWETASDMDAKGHKNVARMMRENKAIAQVSLQRPNGNTLYHVVLFENGRHSKIISLGRVKNPKRKPAKKRNISIKVGGKTRFKATKKGVSIGGRIQLKANPKGPTKRTLTRQIGRTRPSKTLKRKRAIQREARKAPGYLPKLTAADLKRTGRLNPHLAHWCTRCRTKLEDEKGKFTGKLVRVKLGHREIMCPRCAAHIQGRGVKKQRNGIFERFTGRRATKQTALNAPDGTPRSLDKLGKLIGLYAEKGTIKPRSTVWLCADSKGKLHLATSSARLIDGGPQSFGEVKKIEYETTKKHLDGKPTIYFHHFGEEGGKRPTLHADGKGGLKLRGGSYKIRAEGIRD